MKRFISPDKLVIGRQYHLRQINAHSPYILLEILPDNKVRIRRLDGDLRERIVSSCKLKATNRHDIRNNK